MVVRAGVFVAGMADQDRACHQFMEAAAAMAAEAAAAHIGHRVAGELLDERLVAGLRRAAKLVHRDAVALQQRGSVHSRDLGLRPGPRNGQQHVEQGLAGGRLGAFDREQPPLRDAAAVRRNPVRIVAGLEHAVAGHDDHEGIAAERLRHRIDRAGRAQGAGDLVIGPGFAAGNVADGMVDALVEGRDVGHVERHAREVTIAAAQGRDDALDGKLDLL
ncbi:hypothetical protein chiPu_0030957, partial [Chiloscyllium punctatum]|nr:hypothetical protein [Chiloscyllium punctatum]